MQEIIKLLTSAYELCLTRVKEYEGLVVKNNAEKVEHDKEAVKLNQIKQDLAKREDAVKSIENIVKYRQDAEALASKAKSDIDALQKERVQFDKDMTVQNNKLKQERALNEEEAKHLMSWNKELAEKQKKLDEDRAKMKETVFAEVKAKLGIK